MERIEFRDSLASINSGDLQTVKAKKSDSEKTVIIRSAGVHPSALTTVYDGIDIGEPVPNDSDYVYIYKGEAPKHYQSSIWYGARNHWLMQIMSQYDFPAQKPKPFRSKKRFKRILRKNFINGMEKVFDRTPIKEGVTQ